MGKGPGAAGRALHRACARQPHPGSMLPALLIHLQVQIKQKGQTGKSFVAGRHIPTTPQPHVTLWPVFPLPAWTLPTPAPYLPHSISSPQYQQ